MDGNHITRQLNFDTRINYSTTVIVLLFIYFVFLLYKQYLYVEKTKAETRMEENKICFIGTYSD